jgi:hypothetical protein
MQDSNPRDTIDSVAILQEGEAKNHLNTCPKSIQATILDLNSHPVRANLPMPVLRRTASGYLFQPWSQVIKAVEMMCPVPTEEEQDVELTKWARGEEVTDKRGKKGVRVRDRG